MTDNSESLVHKKLPTKAWPNHWKISNIIDGRSLRIKLTAAALDNLGDEAAARKEVLNHLHGALFRGRMIAQERLQQGSDGLDTARLLAAVQDEVLHALYDYVTVHVHRARNPTEGERLAVFATGGYGRHVLAPSSDIDLLFIRPYKASAHAESVIEYMLYALWDMGLKVGHAFRTPADCVRLSREDVTIKTSLLDARFLFGDDELGHSTIETFREEVIDGQDYQFITDKLAERDNRHAKLGNTRYVVEPNVKDGKGGLRDLQTLYWIAKHIKHGETLEDVMQSGPFTKHEYAVFIRAARFLWTVRCHLHYLTGRAEERLSFDLQPEIASRMGYRDRAGQLGVERFMKHYFLVAKDVGGLTRILAAKLEAEQKKKPEGWRRFIPAGQPKPLPQKGFAIDGGRVNITDDGVFKKDPANLIRLFAIADETEHDIHPDAMTLAARSSRLINPKTREMPEMRDAFLKLLVEGRDPGLALHRMNEADVLGRFLPEFGGIVAQTQFNMYHHFTVDEHTIRAVEYIAEMDRHGGEGFELAHRLFQRIENKQVLYLAMLLHDTGKGHGDQQVEGMKTATKAGKRLGLTDAETDLIAWLVGHHLEMSETAQKRDIADPATIVRFAAMVGSLERLRLLYILTIADIRAVGPGIWNAWKGQLLEDLYHNTEAALRGGRTDERGVSMELQMRASKSREALQERVGKIPTVMAEMDPSYWTGFDVDELTEHASKLSSTETPVISAQVREDGGGVSLLVAGHDRLGLFARLAGTIAAQGANVVSAQVYTGPSGFIVDVFILQDGKGGVFAAGDESRLRRLESEVRRVFTSDAPISNIPTPAYRREAAFRVIPQVEIDEAISTEYTVIDVAGRDRPGLLHDVATVLADRNISIHSAHVGSYGERVFDAFYVQLPEKFTQDNILSLKEQLLDVLRRDEPDAPRTPARSLKQANAADSF
ncbi:MULTISPECIES: [protein-PII] uridylyltransferase [Henriciella]|jgi:[protein-PII] uridylyltransferase|uniref:Bifunctional uridylyltransferase/uridylyl-removing enzyme n=1 Tax=Henriciella pelagia TaxID=1977912 RepID=A0ABQ1JU43_9PROT|nr:[protein-PII] uridylyltransferase [Henriciella pelagia]GGB74257.1 bifunctional uridylyltransferase/uridylyl-removing enzyme [Henriciella pelagia]